MDDHTGGHRAVIVVSGLSSHVVPSNSSVVVFDQLVLGIANTVCLIFVDLYALNLERIRN